MANDIGSPPLQLNTTDWKKIGKGAVIALGGAFLTYLAEAVKIIDFGQYTPVAVAVFSVLINFGWKWIQNNQG